VLLRLLLNSLPLSSRPFFRTHSRSVHSRFRFPVAERLAFRFHIRLADVTPWFRGIVSDRIGKLYLKPGRSPTFGAKRLLIASASPKPNIFGIFGTLLHHRTPISRDSLSQSWDSIKRRGRQDVRGEGSPGYCPNIWLCAASLVSLRYLWELPS
jgi:hypothetical protein